MSASLCGVLPAPPQGEGQAGGPHLPFRAPLQEEMEQCCDPMCLPGSSKIWHSRLEQAESWWFPMEQELVAIRIYSQFSQEGGSGAALGWGIGGG